MNEATDQGGTADAGPTVIIAGGSGLIGRRLAAVLGGAGYQVVILTRGSARPAIGPIRFCHWTGRPSAPGELASTEQQWPQVLEGARGVVNLCGETIGGARWTRACCGRRRGRSTGINPPPGDACPVAPAAPIAAAATVPPARGAAR